MSLPAVPLRAAEWIARFLNSHTDFPRNNYETTVITVDVTTGEAISALDHLKGENNCMIYVPFLRCIHVETNSHSKCPVKELKTVAKEIETQVRSASVCNPSGPLYSKPTSAAKKAEWISSVSDAFRSSSILNIMAPPAAAEEDRRNSPHMTTKQSMSTKSGSRSLTREKAVATTEAHSPQITLLQSSTKKSKKLFPLATHSNQSIAASAAASSLKRKSKHACKLLGSKKSTSKKSRSSQHENNSAIDSDAAVASRLQQHEYYNLYSFGIHRASIPDAAAPSTCAAPAYPNNSYHGNNSFTKSAPQKFTKQIKVKVKTEPTSPQQCTIDDSPEPRDYKESAMVESLRSMGFTDMREMLSGIRATATDNTIFIPNQWNQQQHVEGAMMWIINQREEAAEARKLDEARVSSEIADRAIEHSRREETEMQMKCADLNSLFGSIDKITPASKYFTNSVLLSNMKVRVVLHAIGTGPEKNAGIKLLQLEAKARKWYGTVLPYSYFKYVVSPRFENWAKEFIVPSKKLNSDSTSLLIQKVMYESKELERGMYNLSEQDQGSFGMAPKAFLEAQKYAESKGQPISDEASNSSDDVVFIPSVRCSAVTSPYSGEKNKCNPTEIIEIV